MLRSSFKKRSLVNVFALFLLSNPCGAGAEQDQPNDDQTQPAANEQTISALYKSSLKAFNNGRFTASKELAIACRTLIEDSRSNPLLLPYAAALIAKCDFQLGQYETASTEMINAIYQLEDFDAPSDTLRSYRCDLAAMLVHQMKGREAMVLLNSFNPDQKNSPRFSYLLGMSKAITLDYAGAEAQLRRALKDRETSGSDEVLEAEIRQHLGLVLANSGRADEGVKECLAAVESLKSSNQRAQEVLLSFSLVDLGIAYYRNGEFSKAKDSLQSAINTLRHLDPGAKKIVRSRQYAALKDLTSPKRGQVSDPFARVPITELSAASTTDTSDQDGTYGTIGPVEVDYSRNCNLSDKRAELALALVLSKLGDKVGAGKILDDVRRTSSCSLVQEFVCLVDSPTNYSYMLERAETNYQLDARLLADVFQTTGEIDLWKLRQSNPFSVPENRAKKEGIQDKFAVDESKLSAALALRYALKRIGVESSANLDTLALDSDEILLRSPLQFIKNIRSAEFCSDTLNVRFLQAWENLHKKRGNPELELRDLLKNPEFVSKKIYERACCHARFLLAFTLSERGEFEQAQAILKPACVLALNHNIIDCEKERLLEFAIFINQHAQKHAETARLVAQLRTRSTNGVSTVTAERYWLECSELLQAGDPKKAVQVASEGLAWLEKERKKPSGIDDKESYEVLCARLYGVRSASHDFIGNSAAALTDFVRARDLTKDRSDKSFESTTEEVICTKRTLKNSRKHYLDACMGHGGSAVWKNSKSLKVFFDLAQAPREDWKHDIKSIAMASFNEWQKQLSKNNWVVEVKDKSRADLIFNLHTDSGPPQVVGLMSWKLDHDRHTKRKTERYQEVIDLYDGFYNQDMPFLETDWITSPRSRRLSPREQAKAKSTILHEIGHALGLAHSDSAQDIMYYSSQVCCLSARDISTIRRLYKIGGSGKQIIATHSARK